MAVARVALSRHYLGDVIVGLLFGMVVSLFLQLLLCFISTGNIIKGHFGKIFVHQPRT